LNQTKRLTEKDFEECAAAITKEAIIYNKIGVQLSNYWKEKLLSHWILNEAKQESLPESERIYYNLHQHSKVINVVRNLDTTNGIGSLLDFMSKVDNSPNKRITKKPEKEENRIDFAGLWDRSSNEEKLTFFKRHNESQCPTSTKYIARDYFRKLGLDSDELMGW
jgi:hypothetical protein